MDEIINAIPEYVITVAVSTAIVFLIRYTQNLVHAHVVKAKTVQSKELWNFLEQVATTAVNSLVSAPLTGSDKFDQATKLVQTQLDQQGLKTVNVKAIEAAVQAAYEKSPLTDTGVTPAGTAVAIDTKEGK